MDINNEIFLKKFITSIKLDAPAPTVPDADGALLCFNARLKEVHLQYRELKAQSDDNEYDFVKLALNHLQEFKLNRDDDGYNIFKELYYASDHLSLPTPLQTKMNKGIQLLEKRIDYFCSYTKRGLPGINSSYKVMIKEAFGITPESHPREWRENNYLAVVIVKYLNDLGFNNYFFDSDSIVNGEKIMETVYDYCERTTVLLLIAQQETFRDMGNDKNWCFEEFKRYADTHPKQRYQVFSVPNLVEPVRARPHIREWFRLMTTAEGVKGRRLDFDLSHNGVRDFVNEMAAEIDKAQDENFRELVYS
ncbi:hypothetical protein A3860_36490 [Niastella vici]|uniref:TIR domain-containing protein n=1 Tax=Niastella vici TaxID=1703345 RepID=A0A1V9FN15_9BACT|nr:hypothetical protein [Niastella vici]OQP59671.1 hypothetical protein A3860_36490 [Niastella vici]